MNLFRPIVVIVAISSLPPGCGPNPVVRQTESQTPSARESSGDAPSSDLAADAGGEEEPFMPPVETIAKLEGDRCTPHWGGGGGCVPESNVHFECSTLFRTVSRFEFGRAMPVDLGDGMLLITGEKKMAVLHVDEPTPQLRFMKPPPEDRAAKYAVVNPGQYIFKDGGDIHILEKVNCKQTCRLQLRTAVCPPGEECKQRRPQRIQEARIGRYGLSDVTLQKIQQQFERVKAEQRRAWCMRSSAGCYDGYDAPPHEVSSPRKDDRKGAWISVAGSVSIQLNREEKSLFLNVQNGAHTYRYPLCSNRDPLIGQYELHPPVALENGLVALVSNVFRTTGSDLLIRFNKEGYPIAEPVVLGPFSAAGWIGGCTADRCLVGKLSAGEEFVGSVVELPSI